MSSYWRTVPCLNVCRTASVGLISFLNRGWKKPPKSLTSFLQMLKPSKRYSSSNAKLDYDPLINKAEPQRKPVVTIVFTQCIYCPFVHIRLKQNSKSLDFGTGHVDHWWLQSFTLFLSLYPYSVKNCDPYSFLTKVRKESQKMRKS